MKIKLAIAVLTSQTIKNIVTTNIANMKLKIYCTLIFPFNIKFLYDISLN